MLPAGVDPDTADNLHLCESDKSCRVGELKAGLAMRLCQGLN